LVSAAIAFRAGFGHIQFMRALALATKLLLVVLLLGANGCIVPVTPEQQSEWRWKQWNPEYRPLHPPGPGLGDH
jgi:hypothetical protein